MKVYLDDVRPTPDGWIGVSTVKEVIDLLETGQVTEVSLDHDLGFSRETGYDVLTWMEEKVIREGFVPPKINIHTSNPPAFRRMSDAAERIRVLASS